MAKSSKGVRYGSIVALAALSLAGAGAAVAQTSGTTTEALGERESYAFVRTMAGQATVAPEGQGIGNTVEQNQPLLSGDRLRTDGASRLEIYLPDRNRLTLDRDTVVTLDRLAYSGDRDSRITVLTLDEGEILLVVSEEALGDELPRVETGSATIYVQEPGTYRIRSDRDGWIELLARNGYAEIVTDRGSTVVRAGESAQTGSDRWGRVAVQSAGAVDALERWSDDLVRAAERPGRSSRYLDSSQQYASSQLDNYGDWVVYANDYYWRPRVAVGWSPYWDGRWGWTPSGYTWVSYEPWGWVPYHYGRWCMVPAYGWVWRPGTVYSPAWVYWHWSDGYAGWCPTGYYTNYYNPWYRGGFRWGFYGWAGGSWGYYSNWNFAPVHCFRDRNFHGQFRHGDDLKRERGWPEVPRGLITTDTRDFRPDRIDRPDQLIHAISTDQKGRLNRDLPDVTDFVGRRRDLAPPIARAITPDKQDGPKIRLDEPRVVSVPGWRDRGKSGRDTTTVDVGKVATRERVPQGDGGTKDRGAVAGEPGKGGRGETPGATLNIDKGTGSRIAHTPSISNPRTATPGDKGGSVSAISDNRQGWKDRTARAPEIHGNGKGGNPAGSGGAPAGEREAMIDRGANPGSKDDRSRSTPPVERVISGTRRQVPAGESDSGGKSVGARGGDPYAAFRNPDSGAYGGSDSGSKANGNGAGRSTPSSPSYGGGNKGSGSSSDDARPSYRTPAPTRPTGSAPSYGADRRVVTPSGGNGASGGSSYRTAPPANGSAYRTAPPSGGGATYGSPSSGGSAYRSSPPPGSSGGRSAQPSSGVKSGGSTGNGGGKSTGSGSKSSSSSSKSSSGGSGNGSSKSNGGDKRDR